MVRNDQNLTGIEIVSVPLRGKGRDQRGVYMDIRNAYRTFPSPCGEKVGINLSRTSWLNSGGPVSVPLRGKGRDQRLRPPSFVDR